MRFRLSEAESMKSDKEKNRDAKPAPDAKAGDPLSRREWVLRVGSAALAAGLPVPPSSTAAAVPKDEKPPQPAGALPPGLYLPSSECLGRALESDALFHPVPIGCETDYARPMAGGFRPRFFSEDDFRALRRLMELVLGLEKGEIARHEQEAEAVSQWIDLRMASAGGIRDAARALSPEHRAVAAAYYGSGAMHGLEIDQPEAICREGLAWVEHESQQKHGAKFLALIEAQQLEVMNAMSDDRPEEDGENAGTRFFTLLKAEAIRGYYTSPAGLKELNYPGNQFHAASPACNLSVKTG